MPDNRHTTNPFTGTNVAIFALFFGLALIEAVQRQNWLEAAIFLALGVMSLWADVKNRRTLRTPPNPDERNVTVTPRR